MYTNIHPSVSASVQVLRSSSGSMSSPSRLPSHATLQTTWFVIATWFGSILWPLLTSGQSASLWHSHVPPSQSIMSRPPPVRLHTFGQYRLHLLTWNCCLRALLRCANLPFQASLLCNSYSSEPTFAVPLTSDYGSPHTPLRLATGFDNSPVRDFHPLAFKFHRSYYFHI